MDECFNCGITGDKIRLFDAIGEGGIVKVCQKCASNESIPIVQKPTTFQLKEEERKQTVYERLSKTAGIVKDPIENSEVKKQEMSLRDIINKNFESNEKNLERKPRPDLVDNFHWVIMTARRRKKISQEQLAKEIAESEAVIKMAEKGILPEDDYRLINKLENYLGIRLILQETRKIVDTLNGIPKGHDASEKKAEKVDFDLKVPQNLTIADLQEMKKKREEESLIDEEREELNKLDTRFAIKNRALDDEPEFVEKIAFAESHSSGDKSKEKKDLSEKEINDLIFGRD